MIKCISVIVVINKFNLIQPIIAPWDVVGQSVCLSFCVFWSTHLDAIALCL